MHKNYNSNPRDPLEQDPFEGVIADYRSIGPIVDFREPGVLESAYAALTGFVGISKPAEMIDAVTDVDMLEELHVNTRLDLASILRDIGDTAASGKTERGRKISNIMYRAALIVSSSGDHETFAERFASEEAMSLLELNQQEDNQRVLNPARRRQGVISDLVAACKRPEVDTPPSETFEYALHSLFQFYFWSTEKESRQNFSRLARTREDRPMMGMVPELGRYVAHDLVVVDDGELYRIQAKFGTAFRDDYDRNQIAVIHETNKSSADLISLLNDILLAYSSDSAAVERMTTLAEHYLSELSLRGKESINSTVRSTGSSTGQHA